MLFNSIEFAFFLPIVFLIYWAIGYAHINENTKLRLQNAFVLIASYVFYGWWDWRFLLLIAFTSFCSWGSGLLIASPPALSRREGADKQRMLSPKFWMVANIVLNLGILAVFKYYDFFVSEFGQLFGISTDSLLLRIILPVGISFYTFQALSYSIDVYRQKIEPTKDIIAFFAFIAFFPQLVAGPIERATNLLPQFLQNRKFSYDQATDGMRQILWGLFKKIVVADNCATYVDQVWATYDTQTGSTLLLAAVLFTFQIYGDFSGYSDIAIGTAKLFGIKLMRNFNNPYFSRDIAEFWRRWHISLTTWFRDYVYIPLGGSQQGRWCTLRNVCIVFLLCGLWHGANWTYMGWSIYHILLFAPLIFFGAQHRYRDRATLHQWFPMLFTFMLVTLGWILFRAPSMPEAIVFLSGVCTSSIFSCPAELSVSVLLTLIAIVWMLYTEWQHRDSENAPLPHNQWVYYMLILAIWWFAYPSTQEFIYFQF